MAIFSPFSKELIVSSRDDMAALTDVLGRLMSDLDLRRRMGARALEIRERFSLERALAEWDGLFDEVGERWARET